MNEKQVKISYQATVVLDFIDENWMAFESKCEEFSEDPEAIRTVIEKIAIGDS